MSDKIINSFNKINYKESEVEKYMSLIQKRMRRNIKGLVVQLNQNL